MFSLRFRRLTVICFFAALALGALGRMALWEPRQLTVEHCCIELPNLPPDAPPLRVVLLADIHAFPWDGAWLDRIVRESIAQQPQLILLAGDYANAVHPRLNMPPQELAAHLAPLAQAAPCFFITGNHDVGKWRDELCEALVQGGMAFAEYKTQTRDLGQGRVLHLRGIPMHPKGGIRKHFPVHEETAPLLALVHDPYPFLRMRGVKADAVFAGHTHGGQICTPEGRPLGSPGFFWTPDMLRAGLKTTKAGSPLYVTRGLGQSVLPLRLHCPPELSVIELRGKKD